MNAKAMLRRAVLIGVLAAAACSSRPPRTYPPLTYDYLLPLRLNVASVDVQNRFVPASAADVGMQSPARPVDTLLRMGRDRLFPAGNAGQAVFVVDTASILHTGDALYGALAVHLDILGADGNRTAFAEARVARTVTGDRVDDDLQGSLYDLTKQMMDDMNVEFEYQVRRSLKDWLQAPPGPVDPVQSQPLAPPS